MKTSTMLIVAALVLAAATLGGCASDSPLAPTPESHSRSNVQDGVMFTVSTPKIQYRVGQPVKVTFEIHNQSTKAVNYQFVSTKQHDIAVDSESRRVWSWSNGRTFGRSITRMELQPGENKVWTEIWDQTNNNGSAVAPGTYALLGVIPQSGRSLESLGLEIEIVE